MTLWQPPNRKTGWLTNMSPAGDKQGLQPTRLLKQAVTASDDPIGTYPELFADGPDAECAEQLATRSTLGPGILQLLVDAYHARPTLALFIAMTRHRDMSDATRVQIPFATDGEVHTARGLAYRIASYDTYTQAQLIDLITATRGQLSRLLTDVYFHVHFDPAALLHAATTDALRTRVIERIMAGVGLDKATATIVAANLAEAYANVANPRWDGFHLLATDAISALATRRTMPLLRALLAEPVKLEVTAADAGAILAISDKLLRRKLLNLTALAAHMDDDTLNVLAGDARGIHPDAAQTLMRVHSTRLRPPAMVAMLDHLSEIAFQGFLSDQDDDSAYAAVKASRHWGPTAVVLWMEGNRTATGADNPLVLKLAAQQLDVSSHPADGAASNLMALDVNAHLRDALYNAFADNEHAWELAAKVAGERTVATLDELIAVVTALLARPS